MTRSPTRRLGLVATAALIPLATAATLLPGLRPALFAAVALLLLLAAVDLSTLRSVRRLSGGFLPSGDLTVGQRATLAWKGRFDTERPPDELEIDLDPGLLRGSPALASWKAAGEVGVVATPSLRGPLNVAGLYARWQSALGFWKGTLHLEDTLTARVLPRLPLPAQCLLMARESSVAEHVRKRPHHEATKEFDSIRSYVPGDDVRHIDWKATARRASVMVRTFRAEVDQRLIVALDCSRLMSGSADGRPKFDEACRIAYSLAQLAEMQRDQVALIVFSDRVHDFTPYLKGNRILERLREMIVRARVRPTDPDYRRLYRHVRAHHRKRSLVAVLGDFVDRLSGEEMAGVLGVSSRTHPHLFIGVRDPNLMRCALGPPDPLPRAYESDVAWTLLADRRRVLAGMRKLGISTVDGEPRQLAPPVLSRYLELTGRGL